MKINSARLIAPLIIVVAVTFASSPVMAKIAPSGCQAALIRADLDTIINRPNTDICRPGA